MDLINGLPSSYGLVLNVYSTGSAGTPPFALWKLTASALLMPKVYW